MSYWKKTFVSAFVAQIISVIGFSFALPFLPFYIEELGVADKSEQARLAGIVIAATGLGLSIFAPIWGALADKHGRKIMVLRSMFGGTVVLLLMSVVQTVPQLVVCRLLQGALTGTIAASVALVASVSPDHRSNFTLGMMQTAVYLGVTIGPLLGGIVADELGYRAAFRVGALVIFAGGLLVLYGIREEFEKPDPAAGGKSSYSAIFKNPVFVIGVLILLAIRLSNTIANPSFPLIVKEILIAGRKLNTTTGLVLSVAAVAGAVSAALLGHFGDKWGQKRVLITCSIVAAFASYLHGFAGSILQLFFLRAMFGLGIGGMIPAANAMIKKSTHHSHIGKAYGAATSVSILGFAIGPYLGGYIGSEFGLRVPFFLTAAGQLVVALLVMTLVRSSTGADLYDQER